jgi:hypothetical protein
MVQVAPVLSDIVTAPVGVPPNGPVTLTLTNTACPETDGFGEPEIAKAVPALFTV